MPFDPVDPKQALPNMEEGILQYWKEEDVFRRSMRQRRTGNGDAWDGTQNEQGETFSFYDGPPFATGLPHYGHLLAGTIKDVIPRYQTMNGKYVQRRFGWDCHGLPIENLIEQEHDIKSKKEIEEKGVAWFNGLCRSAVQRYTTDWRKVVERMGRWVDMDWDYRTMDAPYMESMWWAFAQLFKKKMIYEGHKPMHICPRCVTPLSNFEVTQGYKDITDHSVIAKFELADEPGTFVLAWTTTPWTLPGNLFLAVGKKVSYTKVKFEDAFYIVASDLVESVFKDKEYEVAGELTGKDLLGKTYTPLFPYFGEKYGKQAFKIVEGDFVTTEDGTGIVHIAPGFGDDDFAVGEREGVALLQHVSMEGKFVDAVTDFAGLDVKPKEDPTKGDQKVSEYLKSHGTLFKAEKYKHSYPHCWRCDSPLLNYATSSWFVKVEDIKEKMLKNNAKTEWVPSHIRDGRYGKWLEGARDWAISRNRYWGTPLPIWRTKDGDIDVVNSRDELMQRARIRYTKVTAVRHGESEGNLIPIYQGVPPGTDLTKNGQSQAKETGKHLKSQQVDIIYCSPLARAKQTAEILAKETGAEVIVDERLREVSFGDYEGKTVDFSDLAFIKARRAHKLEQNTPESIYHFPGMETWQSVHDRMESFMNDMLPRHRGEHMVIVTHADPIQNLKHFFTKEDPFKISHQPYPHLAQPHSFFWDHERNAEMDLHKDAIDHIVWQGPKTKDSINLTLVRHGETDWNAETKEQGHTDVPLNEKGKRQAAELAAHIKKKKFDAIVCSDLARASETAEILAAELGMNIDEKWTELRERDTGSWVGMKQEEILEANPPLDDEVKTVSFHFSGGEGGETLTDFLNRAAIALDRLAEKYAGKNVLVVCHNGTIRALRTLIENRTYRDIAKTWLKNSESVELELHPSFKRIPDVLDCWFESGSMPYAQAHFPFEAGHDTVPPGFPADFIAEGVDQTRAWFYTLMVLATALFDETAFKHVVVNGIVLAEDGKKMSKKLRNYPDPLEVVNKYGADAVRFTLMSSPAVRGEDLRFSEKLVEQSMRAVLLPLWNTYSFFVTYANAAGFEPIESRRHSTHPLDTWIRAEVQDLCNRMSTQLDGYDLSATCDELHETIDALTNWYIRLSRRRFAGKTGGEGEDTATEEARIDISKEELNDALHTLYDVLLTLSQLLAPFCPYMSDAIYLNLVSDEHGSVHLTDWPQTRDLTKDEQALLQKTRLQRLIVSLGNSVRGEQKIKVRQPLQSATIAVPPAYKDVKLSDTDKQLIKQELNVKELHFVDDPGSLAQAVALVNARAVGPRLGGRVQEVIKAGKDGDFELKDDGTILILDEMLTPDEVQIQYRGAEGQNVACEKGVAVSLETEVTEALKREGDARDLIRGIQRLRKEAGLEFTDTIALQVTGADDLMKEHGTMIAEETKSQLKENDGEAQTLELDSGAITITFTKV